VESPAFVEPEEPQAQPDLQQVAQAAISTSSTEDAGRGLYLQHCAACHGEQGNGQGIAARFLNPKPRDFRAGRFRLLSTVNGVPTPDDLDAVLQRGMPGSSMVSWAHLPADQRRQLVDQVLEFRRQGAADIERQLAQDADEELTDEEVAERVSAVTAPGTVFDPGSLPSATPESIARGKELYVSKGCAACHGVGGKGDGQQQMVDSEGFATRPRDLTVGIFKGAHDPQSVYRRIWLGLPGTPMPASQNLSQEEVSAMVDFVLSLSNEPTRESWVLRRRELRAQPVEEIPLDVNDSTWASVAVTDVPLTPLWWRDGATPSLSVQAARDGRHLALRITWIDATPDKRAVLPDEFEDLVAAQFHQGAAEPFLGMGTAHDQVELWQWRAGYHADGAEEMLSDEYPFDTALYQQRAGGKPLPDFVTARAVGNPLAVRAGTAGGLSASGFGSTTFRPKESQFVQARAEWQEGRWVVVLQRPLEVPAGGGLSLAHPGRYSVGFAVWDGAARDRAGQKLISLWNDLVIE